MIHRTIVIAFASVIFLNTNTAAAQKIDVNFDLPADSLILIETPETEVSPLHLERLIRKYVNKVRRQHKLPELKHNESLDPIARDHSKDMGDQDFFDHTNLDGETPTMRGHRAGFVCRLQYDNVIATGLAENLFYTYKYRSVSRAYFPDHVRLTFDWKDEESIAREVVEGWYNSPPHRKNLLHERSRSHGIGVVITSERKIFATQNIC
ncbi:MAG: CAP domain-containing protein [Rhodothermales bacterium]|nr:CAP domain-containing protein [Rhodothermales bacterium]